MLDLEGYGPSILEGAWLTIQVAFLSLALALFLGMVAAVAKLSRNRAARIIATVYTTVIRGIPDLVLMLLIFFGGQVLMNQLSDYIYDNYNVDFFVNVDPFIAGVLTIGFIFGAYMAETFRGAFLAIEQGQIEAGKAYGMSAWQIFSRIMCPQMVRHAIPGIGNNWLVLLKTTALVSIIGLTDMVRIASDASKAVHEPFKFFVPVAVIYLALTAVSEISLKLLEKRYSHGLAQGSNNA
ncbi:ABC transporter permease [Hydrocarboniclastica marina]|uniref:ABC transporter permease subunit n=1 Tax=Hydrocarboniclastica marina TaxID=2259620 RepID=A0A4P7XKJ6_9ALTE|nr:ABC transporter permease [Hydrocarboniclastica marina]QCF26862.1 ABC transporter permease subunit [Hydrocarboniclastica marina]